MGFDHKPSRPTSVVSTDEFPREIALPELRGRAANAFPELAEWSKQTSLALNQWWNSVHTVLKSVTGDLAGSLNDNINTSGEQQSNAASALQSLNDQLASIQKTIQGLSPSADVLEQLKQIQVILSKVSTFGAGLLAAKDATKAKETLGLKAGSGVVPVNDPTATSPTVNDVGAVYDQATLNNNFNAVKAAIDANIADVADMRAKVNEMMQIARDQNLIAKL